MPSLTVFSLIETSAFPRLSPLYQRLGAEEVPLDSTRKAVARLKKQPPDFIIGEFVYGWGNNYSGVHISNLDTLLASLPKYAPDARVIVLVKKEERQFADKLAELFPLYAVLEMPVHEQQIEALLKSQAGHNETEGENE